MDGLTGLVAHIVELKKKQADPVAIQDACRAGTVALLRARQEHRAAALSGEAAREHAAAAKAGLDAAVLRLNSLLYEKQFYVREIAACTSYRSAYPDEEIQLPPEAGAGVAAGGVQPAPHAVMLSRLTAELNARKALGDALKAARAERQREAGRAAADKAQLSALKAPLRGLEQAGGPLLDVLGPRLQLRAPERAAALLPAPLWAINSQFAAARDTLGLPVGVRLEGDAAEAAARLAAAGAGTPGARCGDSGSSGGDVAQGPASKRPRQEEVAEVLYEVHPLSVVVSLLSSQQPQGQQQQLLLEVRFDYYQRPGLVGACCCGGSGGSAGGGAALLSALFPGDEGDGKGYEVLAQLAGPGPYHFGSADAPARPFRWAQDLAGVDVIPSLPPAASPATEQQAAAAAAATLDALAAQRRQQRIQALVERLQEVAAG